MDDDGAVVVDASTGADGSTDDDGSAEVDASADADGSTDEDESVEAGGLVKEEEEEDSLADSGVSSALGPRGFSALGPS